MEIEFLITNRGELYDFKTSNEEKEIEKFKIPSIVNGIKVKSIGDLSYTFSNLYDHGVEKIKKLIIEKGIKKIASFAFSDIDIEIDTVYWTKSCTVIPSHCFDNSNIRNVEGIEQVNEINSYAFYSTQLKRFSWPEGVSSTGTVSFLDDCYDLEEIIFCGGGIKDVDLECLSNFKDVKKIDLSRCGAVNLFNTTVPKYAEVKGKLILPYYVTEVS